MVSSRPRPRGLAYFQGMPMTQPARDSTPTHRYTADLAGEIELRWQTRWEQAAAFRQPNPGEPGFDATKPRFYCLDMFPYPSGAGLHVGHPEGYTATDIISRYKRMKGFNVLHPMGWDAFGLPAEQYAIQTGVHPAITTRGAIDNFRRQLKRFGFSYDWSREFGTIDEGYYAWTQWVFLRLYNAWFDEKARIARHIDELVAMASRGEAATPREWGRMTADEQRDFIDSRRLAYRSEMVVNWCPKLGTVLANDEVIDGRSERGGYPVVRKPLRQWVFRITAYADRLLQQLAAVDWPESTKAMQAEWIGRSEGAEVDFAIQHPETEGGSLRVFTTRPDTLFGATYMVVAPEHPLVAAVLAHPAPETDVAALRAYVERTRSRSDLERQESKEKTGVFTGVHAINPGTGERIPVWAADYVLIGYGTGAIMAVPAHDERDYEFAKAFGLAIRDVVYPRAVLAVRYFARHAYPTTDPGPHWRDQMAEFMTLVAASGEKIDDFGHWLDVALAAPHAGPDKKGRAASHGAWLETFDELGFTSFADVRRRFEEASYYGHHGESYDGPGIVANSTNSEVSLDGMEKADAIRAVTDWLSRTGRGHGKVTFRLRDWVFSRQRYWGEPFPIVYDGAGRAYPIGEAHLPVRLPELADYAPVESDDPQPLLAKAAAWVSTTAGQAGVDPALLPPDTPVRRETNTMPGSAGSSWYAIRYCDPGNSRRFAGREAERYWMGPSSGGGVGGVDLYVGGSEHAVGHLLYARFWQNVLFDLGEVSTPEPFRRLFHQGLITSFAYQDHEKHLVPVDEVDEASEGEFVRRATGERVTQIVAKMSKSLKNVVNPDEVIAEFGADTFRLYEMYMGPLEASKPWNPRDITGLYRFLQRAWRLGANEETGELKTAPQPDGKIERLLHRLISKVSGDVERLSFNTAIAGMIEFTNACVAIDKGSGALTSDQLARFALVLSPFAPHLAEELWSRLGRSGFAMHQPWPIFDGAMLKDDTVEVPVQVAGKVRGRVMIPAGADVKTHETIALADAKVQEFIAGKPVKKIIVVPGRMVNVVV
ncbi:leucyl-tRNA synthetase [Phycisphaerales bacterium]|nr:leucyl-tRNA synthetase [Phycisphaerales bacterium]